MATVFTEDFEGGVNGTDITTSNTAYGAINGASAAFKFDASMVETGTLSAKITTGATPAGGTLDQLLGSPITTKRVMRRYFCLGQLPTSVSSALIRLRDNGGTTYGQLVVNPNGTLQMRDTGGVNVGGVSTFAVTPNEWFRVVWAVDVAGLTQTVTIFHGANLEGSTPNETRSGAYTGGSGFTKIQDGIGAALANFTLWVDAVKDDDTVDPGPAGTPPSGAGTFTETFDSGTNGASITTSNSAYDAVSGGSPVFDATTVFNGLSAKFSTGSTAAGFTLNQNFSPAVSVRYFRRYFLLLNNPAATTICALMRLRMSGTTVAQVVVDSAGKISIRNGGATTVATSNFIIPLGSWFRIGWRVDNAAGTQTLNIYSGTRLQSATPTETITGAYNQGTFDVTNEGLGTPQANFTMWMDSAADDTSSEPGALGGTLSLRAKVRQVDTSWKPGVIKVRQANGTWKIGNPKAHDGTSWI